MKVKQLIEMLQKQSPDAKVYLDTENYPSVDGVYNPVDFNGDEEDAPPINSVLLEFDSE